MRSIAVGFAVALVAGATGCSEQGPSAPAERNATLPPGMFVSNARLNSGNAVSSSGLRSSLGVSAGNVAFVSAAPGTFANATSASVFNRTRGGAPLLIQVKDGGFDPVGVSAEVGDELSLAVTIAGGATTSVVLRVPPRRPPEVVRTTPPKGRTDVALNVQVVVVFSEPVNASSLTTSSVALLKNQIPVKGAVRLSADGLTAEFVPDGPLEPQTSYSLVVSDGVRDLDGDALSGAWTTSFTTSGNSGNPNPNPVGNVFIESFSVLEVQGYYYAPLVTMKAPATSKGGFVTSIVIDIPGLSTLACQSARWVAPGTTIELFREVYGDFELSLGYGDGRRLAPAVASVHVSVEENGTTARLSASSAIKAGDFPSTYTGGTVENPWKCSLRG